ncbi:hypothetical protein J3F83DRAFT_471041 [Trichoderma novae-zelandiae]
MDNGHEQKVMEGKVVGKVLRSTTTVHTKGTSSRRETKRGRRGQSIGFVHPRRRRTAAHAGRFICSAARSFGNMGRRAGALATRKGGKEKEESRVPSPVHTSQTDHRRTAFHQREISTRTTGLVLETARLVPHTGLVDVGKIGGGWAGWAAKPGRDPYEALRLFLRHANPPLRGAVLRAFTWKLGSSSSTALVLPRCLQRGVCRPWTRKLGAVSAAATMPCKRHAGTMSKQKVSGPESRPSAPAWPSTSGWGRILPQALSFPIRSRLTAACACTGGKGQRSGRIAPMCPVARTLANVWRCC